MTPRSYTIDDFVRDTMLITPLMNKIENYIPKLRGGTRKVQESQGNKSLFMSNYSGNLKQPQLGDRERAAALLKS